VAKPELPPSSSGETRRSAQPEIANLGTDGAAAIERICASASFQKTRVLRELLGYLWSHRQAEVSEYQLGLEVLGRRENFDPKLDATVRVNVARLRQRLHLYYESEGKNDAIRLLIPPGAYRIVSTPVAVAEQQPTDPVPAIPPEERPPVLERSRYWRWIAIAAIAVCVLIGWHDFHTWHRLQSSAPVTHPFWNEALRCRKAYSLIVPSPQFFRWRVGGFVARDFRVNAHDQLSQSPALQLLRERWGEPETSTLYTVTTDTVASGEIARYLQDRGVGVDILTKSNVSQSMLEERDAILMFAAANAAQYEPFIHALSFRFDSSQLLNLKPKPGETRHWRGQSFAQDHVISFGLIASLPSRSGLTRQLLLVSSHNHALATLLTSAPLLYDAFANWKGNGRPEFFEMVIRFEVKGMTTLHAEPVAFHGWKSSTPYVLED
jgi:hypothetical protein